MHKRVLGFITLLCLALPLVVFASTNWQLKTQVLSAGGSITTVPTGDVNTYGLAFKTYTTTGTTQYAATITPEAGYKIATVIFDGAPQFPTDSSLAFTIAAFTPTAASQHTLSVNFTKVLYTVAINTADGGYVSPAGSLKYKPGSSVTYTLTPASGKQLVGVTVIGAAGSTIKYYNANTGAEILVANFPAPLDTPVLMAVSNIQATATFTPSFKGVTATVGAPQTAVVGTTVTLTTGAADSYNWLQLGGPATVTLSSASAQSPTFTPSTAGVYTFKVTVTSGTYTDSATTTVTASSTLVQASYATCIKCHSQVNVGANIYANWSTSIHSRSSESSCQGCHVGTNTGAHPGTVSSNTVDNANFYTKVAGVNGTLGAAGTVFCTYCHTGSYPIPHATAGLLRTCVSCHTPSGTGDAHAIEELSCVKCHAIAQGQMATGLVNDNNGVRSIVNEFGKWSHHVTGVTLDDAHCTACHLAGSVVTSWGRTSVSIDKTKHMADGVIHLRNAVTDADIQWDPAQPNHTNMDNFCLSCHSATGATSPISLKVQAYINANGLAAAGKTASPKNPFGDTISNRYDKFQRPGVVDVDDQFSTTNNSHHGVKGPRYSGRTRVAGARQVDTVAFAANSTATLKGPRRTIYDAGNFNALYVPLSNYGGETAPRTGNASLGDDSTLHCGDCHTVGQWKPGSAVFANGSTTKVAIGAHGSNNEYLLRNSAGTDARHVGAAYTVNATTGVVNYNNASGPLLVCYNCHAFKNYGSIFTGTGLDTTGTAVDSQPHAGEYDTTGYCNGPGNTLSFNGYTTGADTDGSVRIFSVPTAADLAAGYQKADYGNIFGIQCANCHNSGIGNAYGGIHGSYNNTNWNGQTPVAVAAAAGVTIPATGGYYIDGMGNVTKNERFLPGLGNAMYVPGTLGNFSGGHQNFANSSTASWAFITGGVSRDTNWEQKFWQQTASTNFNTTTVKTAPAGASAGAGCYTLGNSTATTLANDVTVGLRGPSVTGEGGAATTLVDTWGGCEDHQANKGNGNHGFIKRIIRPVTY